ncbi:acyl-CoA/acyl-ACP dehydrogenase [Phormidium tenue FACHB-886]|nr:acyl-CoA/acyl-ACP dehydrogenase [Phormidium tenue FACHB-886]
MVALPRRSVLNNTPLVQAFKQNAIAGILKYITEVKEFCAANAANVDFPNAFPEEEFKLIAELGFLAAPLRRDLGGLGLGIESACTGDLLMLLKQIGSGNLSVGRIYEGHVNALQLIQTFGTSEQIARYAADAQDRHKIFGVWNAEAADGVKLVPIANGRYRLEGSKTFCSGCGYVDRPFVNGVLPDGSWQMCIVPMEAVATVIDSNWWQPSGMKATASYKVDFTGVELGEESIIGQPGDYFRQPWLSAGVVRFAAVQLGGAEVLFNEARNFLQSLDRIQDPYQAERFSKMAIALETANLWLKNAAAFLTAYDSTFAGSPDVPHSQAKQLVVYANMTRTVVEQACMDVIQLCERSVGTRGLLPPNPMERIIRDLTLYLRQPAYDIAFTSAGQYVLSHAESASSLWDYE